MLLLTAVALAPAFVILLASQISYRSTRTAEVHSYASHMADVVMAEVVRGMTGAATMMVAAGRAALLDPADSERCQDYLSGLMHDFPSLIDIAVAGADRTIFCMRGVSDPQVMQEGIQRVATADPGLVVGTYRPTPSGPTLPIGMALRSADGEIQGYVELSAAVEELQKLVVSAPASSSTVVTDAEGTVLLAVPGDLASPGEQVAEPMRNYVFVGERGTARAPDLFGRPAIIGYRPAIAQFPLSVIFAMPEEQMMATVNRDALVFAAVALVGSMLAFGLAWLIGSRFIEAPVRTIHGAVSARRGGDRRARTAMADDHSEVGAIGTAVDALFDELDRREDLQARAEQQRDIYAREVQHRVKNLLSIIQVVARQTLSRGGEAPEIQAFEDRINAIVRANAKLLAEHESSGTLEELVRETVAPFADSEGSRFRIEGPSLALRSKPALALAMAWHELCTNAAKYGALSKAGGFVDITWRLAGDALELSWTEHGGPPVTPPERKGFGTMLITRALEGETRGTVRLEYAPDGFRFHLTAPTLRLAPQEELVAAEA